MKTICVLLCDDHTVVREGLRRLLEPAEDIRVVGEVKDGRGAVREAKRLMPDVVLMDLSMPLMSGVEATRQIAREVPSARVLVLSFYADEQHVEHAVAAGAAGYLTKGTCASDLLGAIREIAGGNAFFSPSVARCFVKPPQELLPTRSPGIARASTLTDREREILKLIAEGFANRQMAGLLSVSVKTVEKHRQGVMNKLNLHTTALLTSYAVSMGIVEPALRLHRRNEIRAAHSRLNESRTCAKRWQMDRNQHSY